MQNTVLPPDETEGMPGSTEPNRRVRRLLALQSVLAILIIASSVFLTFRIRPLFTQRDELQSEVESLRVQAEALADSTEQLTARQKQLEQGLNAWVQKEVLPVAFIQYSPGIDQSILRGLRVELRRHWIAAAEGQLIVEPFSTSTVRYFNEDDQKIAEEIAHLTDQFFESKGCSKEVRPLYLGGDYRARPGLVEIWLPAGCPR